MENDKLELLERLGKVRRKKIPNFSHGFSQKEYENKLKRIENNLREIQSMLVPNINRVQGEILEICVNKILKVFNYYFNTHTWKENLQLNRDFKKYINELKNFKKKYFGTNEDERDKIDDSIEYLAKSFLSQRRNIINIEQEIKSKNIDPFKEIVEKLVKSKKKGIK
jgi:hypothetical protein